MLSKWDVETRTRDRSLTHEIHQKDKLLHANHYSHVALASVIRIYIRLATLFPRSVDLRRVARDLSQLTEVLARCKFFDRF